MELILIALIIALIKGSELIINTLLDNLTEMAFYSEQYMEISMSTTSISFSGLFDLFFSFGISLIVLKFLIKGFDIYVGNTEGDADSNPATLVVNFIRALAVAVSFEYLYRFFVDIMTELIDKTIETIGNISETQGLVDQIVALIGGNIFSAVIALILVICCIMLWIQFLMRGLEMFILRVGMPIACIGLIDSNNGIFAPFLKKIFQNAFTVLVQIALLKCIRQIIPIKLIK